MFSLVRSIVWMSEPLTRALRDLLSTEITVMTSMSEFLGASRAPKTVAFMDSSTLETLDEAEIGRAVGEMTPRCPVVAICDEPIQSAIGWLPSRPWLSHVVGSAMLRHPLGREHLGNVMATLTSGTHPRLLDWLGDEVVGRRVRLAHAAKRTERLERMTDFFSSKGVSARTIELLRDAAEELLTNAFYDAPVAAGALDKPISREQDVLLPDASACDMVYGCRDDLAIVRVRDPFGSLSRTRLIEVLTRCARTDMQVEVDESMGGAGLGLWRVFSAASFVAISVINNRHTEFLVGIGKRVSGPRPFAFHLFFKDRGRQRRHWKMQDTSSNAYQSITILND